MTKEEPMKSIKQEYLEKFREKKNALIKNGGLLRCDFYVLDIEGEEIKSLDIDACALFLSEALDAQRNEIIEKMLVRAWVHLDEADTESHTEDFGKGWNENAKDMVEFLENLKGGR